MNLTQQITLSIGTNLGNKKENIAQCLQYIQLEIGLILKVSKIYETSSWGFIADSFYNCCLLVESSFSPEILLKKMKEIEQKMGRLKSNSNTYEDRIIDLDIIAIEDLIYNSEKLVIPHPKMQDRNFVLLPFFEVNPNWQHPILQKNISNLIQNTTDLETCTFIDEVAIPINTFIFKNINYIAIEGNIGAGKTTLATKLATDFNAKLLLERFADNPFLPKFYEDQNRYAFPLEMSFLADRYQQLSDDLAQFDLFKDFVVADYHIFKSIIFAKVTLQEDEFRLYKTVFDIMYKEMPKPDLYVYLYQNTERLLENIKKRGRNFEQNIEATYLEKINFGYLDYIKTQNQIPVLVIDVSELDFVKNNSDYNFILKKIQEKLLS